MKHLVKEIAILAALIAVIFLIGKIPTSFVIPPGQNVFEGTVGGGQPLYDTALRITPVQQTNCQSPYTDRTLTAGSYKFILHSSSLYPGDNRVEIRGYDKGGVPVYSQSSLFTNPGSESCLQPDQAAQWKAWRHEMFGELVRDANGGILRYPARNAPKKDDVNRELRQWLIDNGYATPGQIPEGTQLVTDIIALANQHDEILAWTLSDELMQILNAAGQPKVWVTRKGIDQAMAVETGGVSGITMSCVIS